jgi:hypothetical protein
MMIAAASVVAVSAFAQQAGFAEANNVAQATAPGYAFRVDLKVNFAGGLYWEFQINGKDNLGHRIRINTPGMLVKRNELISIDSRTPKLGPSPVVAGGNAVSAAASQFCVDSQVVRFEAARRSDGTIRYRVYLNVLNDGGGVLDQDLEVTVNGAGEVMKIVRNDD